MHCIQSQCPLRSQWLLGRRVSVEPKHQLSLVGRRRFGEWIWFNCGHLACCMMIPLHHHHRHQSSWLKWIYQLKDSRNPNRYYFFSVICAIVLSLPFLFVIENASWTRKISRDMRVYVKPEEITTLIHPSTLHSYSHMLEVRGRLVHEEIP